MCNRGLSMTAASERSNRAPVVVCVCHAKHAIFATKHCTGCSSRAALEKLGGTHPSQSCKHPPLSFQSEFCMHCRGSRIQRVQVGNSAADAGSAQLRDRLLTGAVCLMTIWIVSPVSLAYPAVKLVREAMKRVTCTTWYGPFGCVVQRHGQLASSAAAICVFAASATRLCWAHACVCVCDPLQRLRCCS